MFSAAQTSARRKLDQEIASPRRVTNARKQSFGFKERLHSQSSLPMLLPSWLREAVAQRPF